MDLSPTHVHLLLNHFPTIGFILGIVLFIAALMARSDHLKVASLVIFASIALLTIPTYTTGDAARHLLEGNAELPTSLILMHETAALFAMLLMLITGGFAWLGLWQYRRVLHLPRWNAAVILIMAFVTLAVVSRAANLGGEIRHPEIRLTAESTEIPIGRQIGDYVRDTPWLWPTLETIHFIGLTLLIGVLLLIPLRMFGVIKQLSLGAIDRLLPWAALGLAVNVITGMLFVAGGNYATNVAFYWKLVFIVLAGFNTLYFFFDRGWAVEPGVAVPTLSKVVSLTALLLWVGVLYWGSMLPFIGDAF